LSKKNLEPVLVFSAAPGAFVWAGHGPTRGPAGPPLRQGFRGGLGEPPKKRFVRAGTGAPLTGGGFERAISEDFAVPKSPKIWLGRRGAESPMGDERGER